MRVAAVQLTSTPDRDRNLTVAGSFVDGAVAAGAELVALPELFNGWGSSAELRAGAEPLTGRSIEWARERAARHGIWLLAGSIVERGGDGLSNTSCLIGPDGEIAAAYRKVHLFDVDVLGVTHRESDTVEAGDEVVVADAGPLRVGLAVCYDLRFPELFRAQTLAGATAVLLPSAFTAATGRDHWDPLVRARAIENQVFVIAPDQCGHSTPKLAWHGRSMVVDPWGVVLAQAPDLECFVVADLDLAAQADVRCRLPALDHRRPDVYGRTVEGSADP